MRILWSHLRFPRTSWFAAGCLALASGFATRGGPAGLEASDTAKQRGAVQASDAVGGAGQAVPGKAEPRGRTLALQGRASKPAFSPDGKLIATVGTDGMVTLWDVAAAEPAGPPLELGHEVTTGIWKGDRRGELSFSPDGRSLVWWFTDKVVIWDVATRQVIGRPAGAGGKALKGLPPRSVIGFSPDGQVLLLETRDGLVLWSVSKRGPAGLPIKDVEGGRRFSPDGRILAVATENGVTLWDAAKGEPTGPPLKPPHSQKDLGLAFSPDGGMLAAESSGEVILWDVAKREVAGLLNRSGGGISNFLFGAVSKVVFSPDGRVLVWLSNRGYPPPRAGEIFLWDLDKRKPIVPPVGHPAAWTVALSPDGRMMASGGDDHSLILWDVWSGRALGEPLLIGGKKRHGGGVLTLAFSANGETLVATTSNPPFLELWHVAHQPPQLVRRFDHLGRIDMVRGHSWQPPTELGFSGGWTGAVVSPEGKTLAFRPNGQLALWDLSSQEARDQPVIVPGFEGEKIAFSPDGTTLVTCRDAKERTVITLWDVAALMLSGRGRE